MSVLPYDLYSSPHNICHKCTITINELKIMDHCRAPRRRYTMQSRKGTKRHRIYILKLPPRATGLETEKPVLSARVINANRRERRVYTAAAGQKRVKESARTCVMIIRRERPWWCVVVIRKRQPLQKQNGRRRRRLRLGISIDCAAWFIIASSWNICV